MENIYRGYPLILHMTEQSRETRPYMLYRRENQMPPANDRSTQREQEDSEYFWGLYPQSMKRCQRFVEEGCDRCDYPESPIYDDYPDRETLYRMRDGILKSAEEQGFREDRDIAQLLLIHEIRRRRERR